MHYFIGLDNGGTAIKAVLFDEQGQEIVSHSEDSAVSYPTETRAERDLEELFRLNCHCLKQVVAKAEVKPEEIVALSFSGHGKGLYLWGEQGVIYPGIASMDLRATDIVKDWYAQGVVQRNYASLAQRILPCQQLALLAWLKRNEPSVYRKIKYVFSCKDYLRFRLTGKAQSEITDLSGSGLFNVATKSVDADLLSQFGLAEVAKFIPEVITSTTNCGSLTPEACALTGLHPTTQVVAGMFDIDACALAVAPQSSSDLVAITGTWSINEYITDEPYLNQKEPLMNSVFADGERYLLEACSATSAGNLEWLVREIIAPSSENVSSGAVYERVNELFEQAREENNLLFFPYLYGSNDSDLAKASFIGLSQDTKVAELVRAVFEGVCFSHKQHIEQLAQTTKDGFTRCLLAGGMTKSAKWTQLFADICQLPVKTMAGSELGALGAVIAASVGVGFYPNLQAASKAMSKPGLEFLPNPDKKQLYEQKYRAYQVVRQALHDYWQVRY